MIPYATGLTHRHEPDGRGGGEEDAGVQERRLRAIKMKIGSGDLRSTPRASRGAQGDRTRHQARVDANHCFSVPNAIQARPHDGGARSSLVRGADQPEDHDGYIEVNARPRHGGGGGENDSALGLRDVTPRRRWTSSQPDLAPPAAFRSAARSRPWPRRSESSACACLGLGDRIGGDGAVPGGLAGPTARLRPMPPMLESSRRPTHCANTWRRSRSSREWHRRRADRPGLGIEIDREVLKKYKVGYERVTGTVIQSLFRSKLKHLILSGRKAASRGSATGRRA